MSVSDLHNPLLLKLAYIAVVVALAANWPLFAWLPTWPFTQLSVLWIMCLYRPLNKHKPRSIVGEFVVGFCIRMGWAIIYNLYHTGLLHGGQTWDFGLLILETLIACTIYTAVPISWLEKQWGNQYARWGIFVADQAISNGNKFLSLFLTEFIIKPHASILVPITVLACRSVVRPFTQIVSAYLNNNLSRHNLRKWLKIALRNFSRALTLALINYAVLVYHPSEGKDNT